MRSLTIGKKTFLLALVVSLAGLIAVSIPLIYYQLKAFDDTYRGELRTVSQIAAGNLAPYLDFDEAEDANRMLANLLVQEDILTATIFDRKGRVFGHVGDRAKVPPLPNPMPVETQLIATGGIRTVLHPVEWKGSHRGVLVVVGDYSRARGVVVGNLWRSVFSFGALSCIFALGLGAWLQRFVSRPVKNLAAVAKQISESADYSVRAVRETHDEVGALTEAFNGMLERIASQEGALKQARSALEVKVQALAGSEARVRGIIASLAEALILIAPDGTVSLANPRVSAVLGWAPEKITGCRAVDVLFRPEVATRALELISKAENGTVCSAEMEILSQSGDLRPVEIHWSRLVDENGAVIGVLAAFLDITDRRNAAADLAAVNARLVDASRRAGMAEIATNVLHNVGNSFNSVNVSVTIVADFIRKYKVAKLRTAAELLESKTGRVGEWIDNDERGRHFPAYLCMLADVMGKEQSATLAELEQVIRQIEHIKQIISTQQAYAKTKGIVEAIAVTDLVGQGLELESATLEGAGIAVSRDIPREFVVVADRHKTLQIIGNLLRNAKDSIGEAGCVSGEITVLATESEGHIHIHVSDNGGGIAPEHLTRIFAHGFTTRRNGHGFGLHASALAAMEMNGSLTASSDGPGAGAKFTLRLPCQISSPQKFAEYAVDI